MQSEKFVEWLVVSMKQQKNTARSRLSNCERICEYHGDLDEHYRKDKCMSLLECFRYTKEDKYAKRSAYHNVPIEGDIYNGTATLKRALNLYIHFLESAIDYENNGIVMINGKPKEIEIRDSYEDFLKNFNISKEKFYEYGLTSIIFADAEVARELWKIAKYKLLNNQKISIRSYGRQGGNSGLFLNLYKYIFDNDNICIDPTNNAAPKRIIQETTGYKINGNLFNYQCSHIWGNTKNPLLFEAVWNICLVPRLYDPLTGHECKRGWNEEFSKMLKIEAYNRFQDIIEDYNDFIDSNKIFKKIMEFSSMINENNRQEFLTDALNEWSYIKV